MSNDKLTRHRGGGSVHSGEARTAPYPVSRLGAPTELVDVARQIDEADSMIAATATGKLRVIAEQIQALREQARGILEQTRRDQDLHRAQCGFQRIPGKVYHLYRKSDGLSIWSMLSPDEWRGRCPHEFLGSYLLGADSSWTPVEELGDRDQTLQLINELTGPDAV
ncbi:MAG: DUF2452 domain-containing protein [Gammaproteobacteria bacterium]